MSQFYTLLTKIGLAKTTNAIITRQPVDIEMFAVGDGGGAYYNPTENETALKNERWRGYVNSIAIDTDNPNWINVEVVVPSSVGGFTIREIGLFDTAGDLIAIAQVSESYKPVMSEGSVKEYKNRLIIFVSNASAINLTVDPTVIMASKDYVDGKFTDLSLLRKNILAAMAWEIDGGLVTVPRNGRQLDGGVVTQARNGEQINGGMITQHYI